MDTPTEEVTVDFDKIDQLVADGKAADAANKGAAPETDLVVVAEPEPAPKTPQKEILTPEVGVEKLKQQLAEERTRREEAERARDAASTGEVQARTEVQKTQLDLVNGAIERATQAGDALEQKYAEALTAQDFAAVAKLNREMSANAAELQTLKNGKLQMERAPKPAPRAAPDAVEAYIANVGAEFPNSRAWLREHPEFIRDPVKQRKMIRAHEDALDDGLKADTPEYFAAINRRLGVGEVRQAAETVDETLGATAALTAGGRQVAPAAAPVSRAVTNGSGRKPNQVTLSASEREMARLMFPGSKDPDREYALNKVALQKEGKLQ
jgi:hypothetical protein